MKIVYVVTEDWYFCSHRLPVARGARDAGAEVIVATRVDRHGEAIEREGFRLVALPWRRRTRNPFAEIAAFFKLLSLYRREKPDVIHHVAIKPTVYGGIAATLARSPFVVNAIAGLGYLSVSTARRARVGRGILRGVFRWILRRPGVHVIVQNPDDRSAMAAAARLDPEHLHLIRGSGVDVTRFTPRPRGDGPLTCTMVARMLRSKGVFEMIDAAKLLRERNVPVVVQLVGNPDTENPESVDPSRLTAAAQTGTIRWTPHVADIAPVWQGTDIAVLPTYREGLPMTLLEAAACGLPIVATDVPGCREIVRDGDNGLLVAPRNPSALADAIERLAGDGDARRRMGERGRTLAADEFAQEIVVRETIALYRSAGKEAR